MTNTLLTRPRVRFGTLHVLLVAALAIAAPAQAQTDPLPDAPRERGEESFGLSAPPPPPAQDEVAQPPVEPTPPEAPPVPAPPPPVVAAPTARPSADDAVRLSPPPPPRSAAAGPRYVADAPVAAPKETEEEDDEAEDPMGWLGVSVKLGVANVNSGTLQNPTYNQALATYARSVPPEVLEGTGLVGGGSCTPLDEKCRTPSRLGFHLALTLHVGGDGFGWDAEPYVTIGDEAVAAGLYTGPKFDIHVTDSLYLGFGFGARTAYVSLDGWLHGGDIFGRIPVHATYYVTPNFALTAEGSFGAGVSLFASEPVTLTDPRTGRALASTPKIAVGAARSWDVTLGVRFP